MKPPSTQEDDPVTSRFLPLRLGRDTTHVQVLWTCRMAGNPPTHACCSNPQTAKAAPYEFRQPPLVSVDWTGERNRDGDERVEPLLWLTPSTWVPLGNGDKLLPLCPDGRRCVVQDLQRPSSGAHASASQHKVTAIQVFARPHQSFAVFQDQAALSTTGGQTRMVPAMVTCAQFDTLMCMMRR